MNREHRIVPSARSCLDVFSVIYRYASLPGFTREINIYWIFIDDRRAMLLIIPMTQYSSFVRSIYTWNNRCYYLNRWETFQLLNIIFPLVLFNKKHRYTRIYTCFGISLRTFHYNEWEMRKRNKKKKKERRICSKCKSRIPLFASFPRREEG